jgi:tetratricopeptide (TPR) repeat protein
MITLAPETVSMHRLIQAVLLARQPPGDHSAAFGDGPPLATALDWLDQALPDDPDTNLAGWPLLRALLPHAENLATLYPADDRPTKLGRVQNELGTFRQFQGEYAQALALRESALAIYESALGPDHPDTTVAVNNLAVTYNDLGQADKALPLQQRALEITKAARGGDPRVPELEGQEQGHDG